MSSIAISSLLVALSIVAIVYLTAKVKFSVFGSLFAVSIVLALSTNVPVEKVIDLLKTSFGNTLGGISFIIIFGAAIAVCMERSGGALSIATHILKKAGERNAKPALAWTGFIPGLTIFCDYAGRQPRAVHSGWRHLCHSRSAGCLLLGQLHEQRARLRPCCHGSG